MLANPKQIYPPTDDKRWRFVQAAMRRNGFRRSGLRGRGGGVSSPLTQDHHNTIMAQVPDALERIQRTLAWYKEIFGTFDPEIRSFANFPTLFMGLVDESGRLSLYDRKLRIVDAVGNIVADQLDPAKYADFISEAVEPFVSITSAGTVGYDSHSRTGCFCRCQRRWYTGQRRGNIYPVRHRWPGFQPPDRPGGAAGDGGGTVRPYAHPPHHHHHRAGV